MEVACAEGRGGRARLGGEQRRRGSRSEGHAPSPTWPTMGACRGEAAMSRCVSATHSASLEMGTHTSVVHTLAPGRMLPAAHNATCAPHGSQ